MTAFGVNEIPSSYWEAEARFCDLCVGESYLRREMATMGTPGACSHCGQQGKCFTLSELTERIHTAFEQHYSLSPSAPSELERVAMVAADQDYQWEPAGQPVIWAIADAAEIPEEIATAIRAELENLYQDIEQAKLGNQTAYHVDAYYDQKAITDEAWQVKWGAFERHLKTEARFFSASAMQTLQAIFDGIHELRSENGARLVRPLSPGNLKIYRARAFESEGDLRRAIMRPDWFLSPPPAALASSGRMNAAGISVFYGATTPRAAIAEIRPPVGSWVVVAEFKMLAPLRLLDLTALDNFTVTGSLFDPAYAVLLEKIAFLKTLSRIMTRPILPNEQVLDYLPTQAIADYLATEVVPELDGILFPSSQYLDAEKRKGTNLVLFHASARTRDLKIPDDVFLETNAGRFYPEDADRELLVWEHKLTESPRSLDVARRRRYLETIGMPPSRKYKDERTALLSVDPYSLVVHYVAHIDVKTCAFNVTRLRHGADDDIEF